MAAPTNEFAELMKRAVGGCPEAHALLVHKYSDTIRRVVPWYLSKRLHSICDSTDFVQDVGESFFSDLGKKNEFPDAEGLFAHLIQIVRHKVEKAHRAHLDTAKRDLSRCVPLGDRNGPAAALADPALTPLQAALQRDEWLKYLDGLSSGQRHLVLLLREGHCREEIATRMRVDARTVRRWLSELPAPALAD